MIAAFRRQILCRRNYHVRSKSSVDLSGRYRTSRCKYCDIPMLKDIRSGWIVDALPSRTEDFTDTKSAQGNSVLFFKPLRDLSESSALDDIGQPNIIAAPHDPVKNSRANSRMVPNAREAVYKSRERTPFLLKDGLEIELGGARVHIRGDIDEVTLQTVFDALRPG